VSNQEPAAHPGNVVLRLRKQHGWTQEDLAKEAKLSLATICNVEHRRTMPRPSSLRKLAAAFFVTVADLLK
jgi:transcriptional regulator with XRE-family HTH domain